MFDGWTDDSVHYVALSCTYICDGEYYEPLIACAPLLVEGDLSADQHGSFMRESQELYGKTLDNVPSLIGDNCCTNQCLATMIGKALIGCYAHKFNLAVEHWIDKQPNLGESLNTLRALMSQLRTIKNSAKLRELTCLLYTSPSPRDQRGSRMPSSA